ncbi:ABC transporter permease [uncultured Croceitalea sp.]|uniref:ABC transporter permease n=1 Tax=uncultured Croceitalea sp. TaxID=1798908 RepID=UPI003305C6F3
MIKNHLKIAWRNLLRNKAFSLLNVFGLSAGLAVTTLIILWINFELEYDRFHDKIDRIYEVNNQHQINGELWTWNSTPKPMAPVIKEDYPEVESVSRFFGDIEFLFTHNNKNLKAKGTIVDPDFLNIFSFPLLQGEVENVLNEINGVVITETLAHKMFNDKNPIGKTIKIDNSDIFKITGVLKDLPLNTKFDFEFLIPWSYLKKKGHDDENWSNNSVTTYVMLGANTSYAGFSKKIKALRKNYDKSSPEMVTYLYPYARTYLYSKFENGKEVGGRIDYIQLFACIAGIILLIACINFMNLSTARSAKRAKEVGIKKAIGAPKKILIMQFLGESILLTSIAAVLTLGIVSLVLPYFNALINRPLSLNLTNVWFWLSAAGTVILTGVLAGSYPAFYLSAFRPSKVLKGTIQKVNTLVAPRKILVVLQFTIAIILITATLIISQQLNNTQNRQLGYVKDNLIYSLMEGDTEKKYNIIVEELLGQGAVSSITKTNSPVTESWSNSWDMEWVGKQEDDQTLILRMHADNAVVETMGLELVQGRDINLNKYPSDSTAVILNISALEHMGFEDPIGQVIKDNGTDWHVIGVVKDFVFNSPFQKIEPLIIEGAKGWFNVIHMKLNDANTTSENLKVVERVFEKHNPVYPFNFEFVDSAYANKFNDNKRTKKLTVLFTILTILISCLGLFGLASYMAENRIKEIGIRKVLGASVNTITTLLSKDFLKLVLISVLIATPISSYCMNKWLESFEYRITVSWLTFVQAGLLTISIAFVTVSSQAIRAARSNPIKSLTTE